MVLDVGSGWQKGGDSGPAVVPGKPDDSLLIQAVRYDGLEMPPRGKLTADEIGILERWVAAGAFDPRKPATTVAAGGIDLAEGRKHWAFQPLAAAPVPQVKDTAWPRDDIDRFVLSKLETAKLQPAGDADPHTWLRRVTLDLTGVSPTTEEVRAFVRTKSYEAVVDRLLASPRFGRRWGRHWLDLVGYADQIGTSNDIFAEHAWRYRDYVIDSFNDDVPFDRFIREQLAGDLLTDASSDERARHLTATGFLLLGDLPIVDADKAKLRVDVVDQQIDKISRAFLGLTVACARCHDHKFDPIPQRDYYALAGIFNNTESVVRAQWGVWSWPTVVELPERDSQRVERELAQQRHAAQVTSLKAERDGLQKRKTEIAAILAEDEKKPAAERSGENTAAIALIEKLRRETEDRLKQLDAEITHAEHFAPGPPQAFAVHDVAEPADMRITIRGNVHALGESVPRGFLQVVPVANMPKIPSGKSGRLQLAEWLTAADNPLTPRVAVNRIWQKLFGEGIVRTVDYFGLPGEKPSHPELLDHLARRFVAGGWSQKKLIRELVLSRAYRQSSVGTPRTVAADPDNKLFGRMNRTRLDAESLRDSLLAVAGKLLERPSGPPMPLEFPENSGNLSPKSVNPPNFRFNKFRPEQEFEATVFLPVIRSAPQPGPGELRNVFDFTQPAEFAGRRAVTAVPTQALFLMNSEMMKTRARDVARRVCQGPADEHDRLGRLWMHVLGRPIETDERAAAHAFLTETHTELAKKSKKEVDLDAWTELCHALLASNEFLMRM